MVFVIELSFSVIVAVVFGVVWSRRRALARKRVEEIDQGRRCIACDAMDTATAGDSARCQRCGHRWSIGAFRGARVSAEEIATLTKPKQEH